MANSRRQMMDWDDIRYFLAVAREGSVRAAAERLEVNHSTVLRRIAQLEEREAVRNCTTDVEDSGILSGSLDP